ncbi:GatB/YqeY domain-containing protein [Galbibacter sp.]|jgi:uncharacterized protein YqeY|uniref:GatB/YqeY domain-containing protein n=1 Tax=Galbibacter sp. TaxID=2918471 RepID=UPI003A94B0B0
MSLQDKVMAEMKAAMKAKDSVALESLRAVKSEILLASTSATSKDGLTEEEELKLLQRLVKQRKDSAAIFTEQGREDLAGPELAQAEIISKFLPEQLGEDEIASVIENLILQTGASGMKDMGKVMGVANQALAGRADGKTISGIVKAKLS